MSIRQLEKIKNDLSSGKRTDYRQMSAEADAVFKQLKQTLPPLNHSGFPTAPETHIARLCAEWEDIYLQIKRDCKDKEILMADLEKIRREKS